MLLLTPEMVEQIERELARVAGSSGWGAVTIVVEKGRVTKLETGESIWLGRRQESPPRRPNIDET